METFFDLQVSNAFFIVFRLIVNLKLYVQKKMGYLILKSINFKPYSSNNVSLFNRRSELGICMQ